MLRFLFLFLILFSFTPIFTCCAESQWWNHVKAISDDKMEGRQTGSRGIALAQKYVVEELEKAGIAPGNGDSYYMPVSFTSTTMVEDKSKVMLMKQELEIGKDIVLSAKKDINPAIEAPLVFIGYGLNIPEHKYNDFDGVDLKGKIAVILSGVPSGIPAALTAHYSKERIKELDKAQAIGTITLLNPNDIEIPWSRIIINRHGPSMKLSDPVFDEAKGVLFGMRVNNEKASEFFMNETHSFESIVKLDKEKKPLPHFAMNKTISVTAKVDIKTLQCNNIVAKLMGTDDKLKDEYVALSAHIDHLGIGAPINGDKIYNGAMDNASGVALMLDIANSIKTQKIELKRSLLFVFVTAEEKGLLGSKYFAQFPSVNIKNIVANLNLDMFRPIIPLTNLSVLGMSESDLGPIAQEVAASYKVGTQLDPQPEKNYFVRSDQYSFIAKGVPALFMFVAHENNDKDGAKIFKDWNTNRYHSPSDDINQPVNHEAALLFSKITQDIMVKVANQANRPRWNNDSFFKRFAP